MGSALCRTRFWRRMSSRWFLKTESAHSGESISWCFDGGGFFRGTLWAWKSLSTLAWQLKKHILLEWLWLSKDHLTYTLGWLHRLLMVRRHWVHWLWRSIRSENFWVLWRLVLCSGRVGNPLNLYHLGTSRSFRHHWVVPKLYRMQNGRGHFAMRFAFRCQVSCFLLLLLGSYIRVLVKAFRKHGWTFHFVRRSTTWSLVSWDLMSRCPCIEGILGRQNLLGLMAMLLWSLSIESLIFVGSVL